MERFPAASALIGAWKPDRPVIGLRPHAAGQAARWFLQHFPGDVAYAYKANSSVFLLGALYGAGIRSFGDGIACVLQCHRQQRHKLSVIVGDQNEHIKPLFPEAE